VPGTAGLQHRIGGLEKADRTGNISYDPANHDFMTRTRQAKVDGIAATIPPTDVEDPDGDARVAVIGWGSTYGPIGAACRQIRASGRKVAQIHLRHLNPFPADLGDVLRRYDRVVCPEMNLGQLALLLRAKYLVDVHSHTQVRGLPFRAAELATVVQDVIDSTTTAARGAADGALQ
jgi:2-oxoglutarate ferredoxin oxidoreductase subunit alpha